MVAGVVAGDNAIVGVVVVAALARGCWCGGCGCRLVVRHDDCCVVVVVALACGEVMI